MSPNSSSRTLVLNALRVVALPAWVFVGFMTAQYLVINTIEALQHFGVSFESLSQVLFNSIGNVIVYALAIAIVIGVPWLVARKATTWKDVGLHRLPTWMDMLLTSGGALAYLVLTFIFTALAMTFLPFIDYTQAQQTGFAGISGQLEYILAFVSLVVVAPFAEELLFRGYLFGKLRRHAPVWLAMLITSLLFAAVHFQWNVGIDVFALSLVLCLLRVISGSLWPSIMLHMIKNGIAFYFLFINPIIAITIGG